MSRALIIVDVQRYFTEGIPGGTEIAQRISGHLQQAASDYDEVVACRDWHDGDNDNGGHFAWGGAVPDFVTSWPVHCVAGEPDGDYDPALRVDLIRTHVKKGQGKPDFSIFGGMVEDGTPFEDFLRRRDVTDIDACGLSVNGCVRASVLDALASGRRVRLLASLTTGRDPGTVAEAIAEMREAGADIA